jgi:hypothetical protein
MADRTGDSLVTRALDRGFVVDRAEEVDLHSPAVSCEVACLTNGTACTFGVRALTGSGWPASSEPSVIISGYRERQRMVVTGSPSGLSGREA